MATSGAMADFARMPTQPEGARVRRDRRSCSASLYWQFVFKNLKENLERAEAENAQKLVQQNKTLEDDIPEYEVLQAQMAELQQHDRGEPEGAADGGRGPARSSRRSSAR